jgi:uncharacterized protein (DUF433 family)
MLERLRQWDNVETLGVGSYTVAEAARLLKVPAPNINRWLGGYSYGAPGSQAKSPPLWTPQLPANDRNLEIGFRDLIELRFVDAFLKAGLSLSTIRRCLDYARQLVKSDRPFSTQRFRTDGRTILLESQNPSGEGELLDLKRHQYAMKQVIERSFKDLDIEDDAVVRWRPFKGKNSIVIDPARAFGQPIAVASGIPTVALAQSVQAEGSVERTARLYEVPVQVVRDAVKFEESLLAA